MKNDLKNKVVVVTGASAGLGRAIVRKFAKQGAKIGLIARGIDGLEGAKREVEEMGSEALIVPTDVSDSEAVEKAATLIENNLGLIDVWINNAMVSVFGPLKEMNAEEFKRVTDVTYLGQVYGTMSALKKMLPRNKGKNNFNWFCIGLPWYSAGKVHTAALSMVFMVFLNHCGQS